MLDAGGPDALALTLEADGSGAIYPVMYTRRGGAIGERASTRIPCCATTVRTLAVIAEVAAGIVVGDERLTLNEPARDDLVPVALEEALAVDVHLEPDGRVEVGGAARLARPGADLDMRECAAPVGFAFLPAVDDVGVGSACAGSPSRAVIRSVSPAYRRRPSGTMSSPPSWMWTVTEPAMTSSSIRHTGGSAMAGPRPSSGSAAGRGQVRWVEPECRHGRIPDAAGRRHDREPRRDGVVGPRWRWNVAGSGDGHTTGHSDELTATRRRWPGSHR